MLPAIRNRYLLCVNVNSYRDAQGCRYLDGLWYKDLREHARYLKDLTVASPCQTREPPAHAVAWHSSQYAVRFVDLPHAAGTFKALLQLPAIAVRLWREIGRAEIVHVGIAGWPIPFG